MNGLDRSLSLVTVFFEAEIGLAALQARSLVTFGKEVGFESIVVVDNTYRGVSGRTRARLLTEFGSCRDQVTFVRPGDLVDLPVMPGWVSQQVLKLMIHKVIDSRYYVVLDAKNHWIQPTSTSTFVNPDGRARGASHSYRGHALESEVAGVMRYLEIDPEAWLDYFYVTHTPVVLETAVVADLVNGIEQRSGRPFAVEFAEARLLEFPLYASWIIAKHGGLAGHIDGSVVRSTTIWPSADTVRISEALVPLLGGSKLDSPFLAIHRRALARASLPSAQLLAQLWVDRGLFSNQAEALHFIGSFKVRYLQAMSIRKLRQTVHKVSSSSRP